MICRDALTLIMEYEGLRTSPYICPAGVPTIGYGTTHWPNGDPVTMNDPPIDKVIAEDMLILDTNRRARRIEGMFTVDLSENELGALTSFAYNVGIAALNASTLRRKLNRGDRQGAAAEFPKWKFAKGKVLPGLVRRRAAEMELFLRSGDSAPPE